ncbi:MAG: hypothetical protein PHE67_10240 [Campylobacterales bacterium]|nr:hypothetical protein [Campylobacterales bacterium]
MKIGESKAQDLTLFGLQSDKITKKSTTETAESVSIENSLETKNASFVSDVKAINEMMVGIGLTEGSLQKVSGDKMEAAVKDLRSITSTLKDILARNFEANDTASQDYSLENIKSKLTGTNASNLHNFDYLASKATSLLA